MKTHRLIAAVLGLGFPFLAAQSEAAEVKVLASTAMKTVLEEIRPQFEKATGNNLVLAFGPAAVLKTNIDQGATFDVAILTLPLSKGLAEEGKTDATLTTIAHAGIGVAIHKGGPKPDISTTDAFKRSLLNAKSVGFTAAGASGVYLKTLFDKLGIAEELKPKLKLLQGGAGEAAANGEVEIGLTQISEILPYANAELVGPLPADIQSYTYFSASVSAASKEADAAKAFVKFLAAPDSLTVIKTRGMEPGRPPDQGPQRAEVTE
jgi:molybdate transport system substrate-binding protein